ncbi:hypothetical protein SDC9_87774 [bioreactor metagenome]|uniref:Uncharacterized protein n=1 Tax=bioreactor metagenome TaxID=1076179 RepID=A0A644ZU73_9ZZZZ
MYAVLVQVVPEFCGGDVPEGIGKVVDDHFGLSCGSRREIENHDILVLVHLFGFHKRYGILYAVVKVNPPFGNVLSNHNPVFYRR